MFYPVAHPIQFLQGVGLIEPNPHAVLMRQFEQHAETRPNHTFLRFEDQRFSYAEANVLINRHAHAYRELGIKHGDTVALLLDNRPEFLWHLFGLHKLGAVASLINTHLVGDSLGHAIHICEPRHVVVGSELWSAFAGVRERLSGELPASAVNVDVDPRGQAPGDVGPWNERLVGASSSNPEQRTPVLLDDQAAYIYTSGTTGLPKAAVVRHSRFFRAATVWAGAAFRYRTSDVLYNCLPLYHANGLLLATGSVVTAGVSMALSRKFSRSGFWRDIRRFDASAFIYIGELCRYLMNNPPADNDRDHRVRVVSGNGLRPDIWRKFQRRFGISRVAEFYGATEGNCITLNSTGVEGSVGKKMPGMALARWNEVVGDFERDARGRLVRARRGEPGVLLGRIRHRAEFDGYHDKAASERKVVRDAFMPGDAWFNTGDLLRVDHFGNLFFVDRLGDTFRWKGENVATSEVQEQVATLPNVQEVNVYGVIVPGAEGRAGMAAIVLAPGAKFDAAALRQHVADGLPGYARPIFIRLLPELSTTSTLKLKKGDLQTQGYDPRRLNDPLFVLHPKQDQYVPLTPQLYDDITAGRLAL
ncbi:MAG: long-chain-acyl-CoA synthetase [Polyangiales bacterium]